MRSVLVTGGAGYVGSHCCKALAAAGFLPITFDNLVTGHRWAVRWGPLELGNIADQARLDEVLQRYRPIAALHFAAQALIHLSVADPLATYRNNVGGTLSLAVAVGAAQIPIVFSSTCSLYGVTRTVPISESHGVAPINPYAASKAMAERLLLDTPHLRSVILRYFNAAGADPDGEIGELHDPEPHLIPNVLRVAAGQQASLQVNGDDYDTPDGTCVRDFIHVSDLATAHVAAVNHLLSGGASLLANLGTGQGHSIKEVVQTAEAITGRPIPCQVAPRRVGDPPRLVADASYALQALGWRAQRSSLDAIITDAWRWQQKVVAGTATS